MAVCIFPLLLMTIRDVHVDRKYAEKDIRLRFYGRLVYIVTQVISFFHTHTHNYDEILYLMFLCVFFAQTLLGILPNLCIWLAYLLPAHSMAGLYSYSTTNETGVYLYIGISPYIQHNSTEIVYYTLKFVIVRHKSRLHAAVPNCHSNAQPLCLPSVPNQDGVQHTADIVDVGDDVSWWLHHSHWRHSVAFVVERDAVTGTMASSSHCG